MPYLNKVWNFCFGVPFVIRVSPYHSPGEGNLVVPRWYGRSHHDARRPVSVYYPIPVNLVVAAWQWLFHEFYHSDAAFWELQEFEIRKWVVYEQAKFQEIQAYRIQGREDLAYMLELKLFQQRGVWHGNRDRMTTEWQSWAARFPHLGKPRKQEDHSA